ncbi:MAG: M23 family metallopeptidase [Candidatus Saganbacteria bacterium]|nr:M23 family metallopeptidase [Candidatus Saganbacteria bacterium]
MRSPKWILINIIICIVTTYFASSSYANIWLSNKQVGQGETFAVYCDDLDSVSLEASCLNQRVTFFPTSPDAFTQRALFAIPLEADMGAYPVLVSWEANNKRHSLTMKINIVKGKFQHVNFNLPKSKKPLLNQNLIVDEWGEIEEAILNTLPEQKWEGSFTKPCPGVTSLPFGTFELINGKTNSRHKGSDIYNEKEEKTDILASNNGVVVIAKTFKSFGNTVVINHGQNVFSIYFHLSKILVQKEDTVKKGDLVGKMGTTGMSTAPHLHFALSVNNHRVNPNQWLSEEF